MHLLLQNKLEKQINQWTNAMSIKILQLMFSGPSLHLWKGIFLMCLANNEPQ